MFQHYRTYCGYDLDTITIKNQFIHVFTFLKYLILSKQTSSILLEVVMQLYQKKKKLIFIFPSLVPFFLPLLAPAFLTLQTVLWISKL